MRRLNEMEELIIIAICLENVQTIRASHAAPYCPRMVLILYYNVYAFTLAVAKNIFSNATNSPFSHVSTLQAYISITHIATYQKFPIKAYMF